MTLTLLPKEQVDVLRSIGEAANVLVALFLIDRLYPGRSTTAEELGIIFGKDERSINKRLMSLCGSDRALFDGRGYVLLEGGRALLLASAPVLDAPGHAPAADDFDQALALSPATLEQAPQDQALPEIITLEATDPETEPARAMRAPLEEEEDNHLTPEDMNTSSFEEGAQNVQPSKGTSPTTVQILDATQMLFGKTMTTGGLETKSRRLAIGWVAQAWDQRGHLRSPQGLIFSRLRANAQPQQKYYDHPRNFLPESYLRSLGLEVRAAYQAPDYEEPEIEVEAEPAEEPSPESEGEARQVWDRVLEILKGEMHRAPFETWAAESVGSRITETTIYVAVRNSYTAQWLDARLKTTAERLLIGITNRPVNVKFFVEE